MQSLDQKAAAGGGATRKKSSRGRTVGKESVGGEAKDKFCRLWRE
jgi:hypothetical protein